MISPQDPSTDARDDKRGMLQSGDLALNPNPPMSSLSITTVGRIGRHHAVILSGAFSRSSFRASVEESCARKRSRTFETSSQKRVAGSCGGAAVETRGVWILGGDGSNMNYNLMQINAKGFYAPAIYFLSKNASFTFSFFWSYSVIMRYAPAHAQRQSL